MVDLIQAFGIDPSNFYAVFGSKLGLYTHVLQRHSQTGAIPIDALLRDDQPVTASLIAVLQKAARRYVINPTAAGCLVLEEVHCQDVDVRGTAGKWHAAVRARIRQYIVRHRLQDALRMTDYMDALMLDLSAEAREGDSLPRFLETVRLVGLALEHILSVRVVRWFVRPTPRSAGQSPSGYHHAAG